MAAALALGRPALAASPWWSADRAHRYCFELANSLSTDVEDTPLFVRGSQLSGGATPMKESSIRAVYWNGTTHEEIAYALHDWTDPARADLDDADGDLDADDELLLLVDLPAGGSSEYCLYYSTIDETPPAFPEVSITPAGDGFANTYIDGMATPATSLQLVDGATLFDLMLTDSAPFWNTPGYVYNSSAMGPRIDNLTLPDGTPVFATVVEEHTGQALSHTLRLGPLRIDGNFNLFGTNHFFQPHLVSSIGHSEVRGRSKPLAAVVVLDTEFYAVTRTPSDRGDVRLVGYLFDRGSQNEVLMRWRVTGAMDGTNTIGGHTSNTDETEFHSLLAYLIEEYDSVNYSALIDIDTFRADQQGTVQSLLFNRGSVDERVKTPTDSWALMADTDDPFGGVVSTLVEGLPVLNGTPASTWGAAAWDDGSGALELNEFQSEWNLFTPS